MRQSQTASRPIIVLVIVLAFLLLLLVPGHTLWNRILRPAAFGFFLIFGVVGLRFRWAKTRRNASPLESATGMAYLIFFGFIAVVSAYELVRFGLTLLR